jgi:two-component sensor histidine kinase
VFIRHRFILAVHVAFVHAITGRIHPVRREAEHRTKNILATVQAAVRLSHSDTPDDHKDLIEARINALAKVRNLFVQSGWTGAELYSLVIARCLTARTE